MHTCAKMAAFAICFSGLHAIAQTTVTTSGGTSGALPVFTGNAAVSNSSITNTGGKVGIGVSNPGVVLDVNAASANGAQVRTTSSGPDAAVSFKNSGSGGREYWWNSGSSGAGVGSGNFTLWDATAGAARLAVSSAGNVGIGTTTPTALLQLWTPQSLTSPPLLDLKVYNYAEWALSAAAGNFLTLYPTSGLGNLYLNYGPSSTGITLQNHGNVGINTTNPSAILEVNGNVKLTTGSSGSITFADGATQTTAWTGVLCGGDYAESVDVSGARAQYEPGDLMVLDPTSPGNFLKSTEPYSTLVAGIYSTKPGVVGPQIDRCDHLQG